MFITYDQTTEEQKTAIVHRWNWHNKPKGPTCFDYYFSAEGALLCRRPIENAVPIAADPATLPPLLPEIQEESPPIARARTRVQMPLAIVVEARTRTRQ